MSGAAGLELIRCRLRLPTRATHRGAFNALEATGRAIVMSALVIGQIADGRIIESRGELDFAGLWRQLSAPEVFHAV